MDAIVQGQIVALCFNAGHGRLTENCSRCVVASKASLAHTRAVRIVVSLVHSISSLSSSSDSPVIEPRVPNMAGMEGRRQKLPSRGVGAYPLSMTSAATSSVERDRYQ